MNVSKIFGALLLILTTCAASVADDTEIFLGDTSVTLAPPLVMFTLDYRPNLGSTFCSDVLAASCASAFGADSIGTSIYTALKSYVPSGQATRLDAFRAVFKVVFEDPISDGKKIGFMMNHDHTNSCVGPSATNCSNGGYVLRGFELFEAGDINKAKQEILDILGAIPAAHGGVSHPYQGKELFFELYRYLSGQSVLNGKLGFKDFSADSTTRNLDHEFAVGDTVTSPTTKCAFTVVATGDNRLCEDYIGRGAVYSPLDDSNYIIATKVKGSCPAGTTEIGSKCYARISSALTWDPNIITPSNKYISPYTDGEDWSCSGAYTINMMFQVSNQEADSDSYIGAGLSSGGMALSSSPAPSFPTVIGWLKDNDHANGQASGVPTIDGIQDVTSFFLVENVNTTTNGYAAAGGTTTAIDALSDPRKLYDALITVFNQINSVSTTFVAVTVPVNSDNRTKALSDLYVALFQIDQNGYPLWWGNVKKLDFVTVTSTDAITGEVTETERVVDAITDSVSAFSPISGRIRDDALTFWTDPAYPDVVAADVTKSEISGRDGSSLRRGGFGHKIPGYPNDTDAVGNVGLQNANFGLVNTTRQVFLEPETFDPAAASGNALIDLNAHDASPLLVDVPIRKLLTIVNADDSYNFPFIQEVLTNAAVAYTPASLATGTAAQKEAAAKNATQVLLKWVRGYDVFDWDVDGSRVDSRWLVGDILHSKPLSINYGQRTTYGVDNQDVRIVFGSNDGMLHFMRNTLPGGTKPSAATQRGSQYGEEMWAFMPREMLANVPRLLVRANVGENRPYGVDGQVALFNIDNNTDATLNSDGSNDSDTCGRGYADADCDKAYIYFGLRRGGKAYYALNVSNPDQKPRMLWKVDKTTTGYGELGMTFSNPRVGWVQFEADAGVNVFGGAPVPIPVVIFGGGYNGGWNAARTARVGKDDLTFTADDTEGNAIFMAHARTGALIWKATNTGSASKNLFVHADMDHGIPSDVAPMDSNGNGILDRLYVGDVGGKVWRVDLPEGTGASHRATNWTVSVLANLSGTGTSDLRFFHAPSVIQNKEDGVTYDGVAIASGDRAHPQSEKGSATGYKNNWFFYIKDLGVTSGSPVTSYGSPASLNNITSTCLTAPCAASVSPNGWRLALEDAGEKGLSSPIILFNTISFTTYLPEGSSDDSDDCVPLGVSRLYQVNLRDGSPTKFLSGKTSGYVKADRYTNLFSGIDGGVVAISPNTIITSSGKTITMDGSGATRYYWRETDQDNVK